MNARRPEPGRALGELRRPFPGVPVWLGEHTRHWWAFVQDRTGRDHLVEAATPAELARLLAEFTRRDGHRPPEHPTRPMPRLRPDNRPDGRLNSPLGGWADGSWTGTPPPTYPAPPDPPTPRVRSNGRPDGSWTGTAVRSVPPASPVARPAVPDVRTRRAARGGRHEDVETRGLWRRLLGRLLVPEPV